MSRTVMSSKRMPLEDDLRFVEGADVLRLFLIVDHSVTHMPIAKRTTYYELNPNRRSRKLTQRPCPMIR